MYNSIQSLVDIINESRRNSEIVDESFDSKPVSWQIVKDSAIDAIYRFILDRNTYLVFFNKPARANKPAVISFALFDEGKNDISYDMTSTGNQFKVLATVLDTIQDFIKREDPNKIEFSARKGVNVGQDSKSRFKVYERMIKKFLPASEWDYTVKDKGLEVHFLIDKKQIS